MTDAILALDQGTTSTRAILFDTQGRAIDVAQEPLEQSYPQSGWVEHFPQAIWLSSLNVTRALVSKVPPEVNLVAFGITNQRETTIIWDKTNNQAIYPAIVWQDRRTLAQCEALKKAGKEDLIQNKTGLLIDPYFSALKIVWILDNVPGAREKANKGELLFGTVDSYLIWHFTNGKVHATDVTNASRTLLYNINTLDWDDELLALFNIPRNMLPKVLDSAAEFGVVDKKHWGVEIPLTGVIGDQQAASLGQACVEVGDVKCTYGTGCFMLMNTGKQIQYSSHKLLSTIAFGYQGEISYALEGSIFMAGAIMQWLRDGLNVLPDVSLSAQISQKVPDNSGVMMLPAFQGLGAPFWDASAKGAILGLTPDTHYSHITRAALESVAFQTKILVDTFKQDAPGHHGAFKVDGGMCANDWLLQALSNTLQTDIIRPVQIETTALGAAFAAGLGAGVFTQIKDAQVFYNQEMCFVPDDKASLFQQKYFDWLEALTLISPKVKDWHEQKQTKRQA